MDNRAGSLGLRKLPIKGERAGAKNLDCTVYDLSQENLSPRSLKLAFHYVNVSVLIKFSEKTSVFTLIIISSP